MRFEHDERTLLQLLAARPYQSLVLPPGPACPPAKPPVVLRIPVERRPLRVYAQLLEVAP